MGNNVSTSFTRKQRLRVLALTTYLGLCLLYTLPGGSRFTNRAVWNSAHNERQFGEWASALRHLGVDVTGAQFKAWLWSTTKRYVHVRNRMLRPLSWLTEQVGFGQGWRMFSNPQTTPSRLWVEVDEGSGFRPIYVSRSQERTWRRSFFEHHRIRKLLGRIGRGGGDAAYAALSKRIAQWAFADRPHAKRVRVRTYTWRTPSPAEPSRFSDAPEFARKGGKFRLAHVFTRSEPGS